MELKIYSQSGQLKATVSPDENSVQNKSVMGENKVNVSFTLGEAILFDVNDYIDFENERYTLSASVRPAQKSTLEFEYSLQFSGIESELSKALCFLMIDSEMDSDFSLTDNPRAHMQLIVNNINRIKETNVWHLGTVITAENKVITYEGVDCLSALNRIAQTFETEWWIEGTTINLCKCEHGEAIELGYGGGRSAITGLTELRKQNGENTDFFTRLYVKGSTRNIVKSSYGFDNLHLPAPLKYLEKNTEYGIIEREVIFEKVYPRRIGSIASIRSVEQTTDGKTITIYYFKDNDLDFNPNDYEIEGLTKHIKFETGELAGYDFEANYNATTGEFELINQYPGEDIQLPGGTMIPAPEDTYVLYNVRMPEEYIPLAEQELQQVSTEYLDKFSIDSSIYSGDSDPIDFEKRNLTISLGRRVKLFSDVYFTDGYRNSRITSFTRNLNNPFQVTLDISEAVSVGRFEALERKVDAILPEVRKVTNLEIIESTDTETIPTDSNLYSAAKSKLEDEKIIQEVEGKFISKIKPDETDYRVDFKDGITTGEYVGGLLGDGSIIDKDGNGEMTSLKLREFLEVPELRFNRVDVVSGELWNSIAFGLIESVDEVNQIAKLKLEDGELSGLHVNDFCRGIFHNLTGNDTSPGKDDSGFDVMVGFRTSYFTPVEIIDNATFKYELKPGSTVHPCKAMKFAVYGNPIDKNRQASAYHTRTYTRYLRGVNTWKIEEKHISMQLGDLSNLIIGGVQLGEGSVYLNNVYFGGNVWHVPGADDTLKGNDAYSVTLSTYSAVYNVSDGIYGEVDVVSGDKQIVTGANDVIATEFNVSTRIQATKGAVPLRYSSVIGSGKYVVTSVGTGCSYIVTDGIIVVREVTENRAEIRLEVNCEGMATYEVIFTIVRVSDGKDGINGMDGVPGTPGKDGVVYYTWIRYADTASGGGISNEPSGKKYIGFAYNKTTPIESNLPSDYTWSKFHGEDGTDGIPGAPGKDGQTTYTWIAYSDYPDGKNMYQIPNDNTKYIGIAVNKTTATESNTPSDYTWSKFKGEDGQDGMDGVPGIPGKDGITYYTWIRYADTASGSGINNSPNGKKYIGFAYNKTTPVESNLPSDYTWSKIQGEDGTDGVPGAPGKDGQTTYTWIAYSDYSDGRYMYQIPNDNTKYIGIAVNKTTATESNTPSDYTWSKFRGTDGQNGQPGEPGKPGKDGQYVEQRYKRSKDQPEMQMTVVSPPGWSLTPPQGELPLWMSKATFNADGTIPNGGYWTWSYPVRISGDAGTPGTAGERGPAITFRGEYSSLIQYVGNSNRVDVVKHKYMGEYRYFIAKATAGAIPIGTLPTDTSKWTALEGQFESIATGLLIAEQANISGWRFRNNYIESQNENVILDGNADTHPRIALGATYDDRDNAPTRMYDNGDVYFQKGVFGGYLQMKFIDIDKSDAIRENEIDEIYTLKNDLNIRIVRSALVKLPTDLSYEGAIATIYDSQFPPYTKTFWSTQIITKNGFGIGGCFNKTEDLYGRNDPVRINLAGGVLQLLAAKASVYNYTTSSYDYYIKWIALNYK